ncbi:MAG: type II toxin-antitoxin system ParD family antitoxin [Bacteroidales bacterium]
MSSNTSISLGNYFDKFIKNRIVPVKYSNATELIRAGLRLLEEEENKIIALQEALQEAVQKGIDSGIAHDFDPEEHLRQLETKKNA